MAPNNRDGEDDEMELINAEFESMVSGLNLDQSSSSTYLDDLDAIEADEKRNLFNVPRTRRGLQGSIHNILSTISRWWRRENGNDSDGAVL